MYRRVVVPLDGSRFAERALPVALGLAGRGERALELISVVEGDHERAAAEKYLGEVRDALRSADERVPVETAVLPGDPPAGVLVDALRRREADLLVMTTHGRGPVRRAWLGSTADGVLRRSPVPLLVVRPDPSDEMEGLDALAPAEPFRRLVVPLDGSAAADAALPHVREVGRRGEVEVTLFRALAAPPPGAFPFVERETEPEGDEGAAERAREELRERARELEEEGFAVEVVVRRVDRPAVGILNHVRETGADLVVMTTGGRGGVSRLLVGSVADKVIRGSDVPVLVVRSG